MRAILRIRRLEIAGKSARAPPPLFRPTPSFFATCVAGPSSRPFASYAPLNYAQGSNETSAYFTSTRPLAPSTTPGFLAPENELESLTKLKELLDLPSVQRTDGLSRRTFNVYRSLSVFTRQQLPQDLIRKVLRNVVPSAQHLDYRIPGRQSRDYVRARGWEERLKFVIADMVQWKGNANVSKGEKETFEDRGEYLFVLARLSRAGRMDAVESIVSEIRSEGALKTASIRSEVRLHEFRLLAIRNRLAHLGRFVRPHKAASVSAYLRRLDEILPIFWNVIGDLRADGFVPRQMTCTVLVQVISHLWQFMPTNHPHAGYLQVLFEEILVKGYGLNMEYLTINKTESKAEIQGFVIRAIVDHLGRKGEVWKMLSAYEVLTQTSPDMSGDKSTWNVEDEDDVGPTLAQMEAKESEERRGMKMWENSNSDSLLESPVSSIASREKSFAKGSSKRPSYLDFLDSRTPSPSTIFALESTSLEALAARFEPNDQGFDRTDIFSTMLKHACAANEYHLAHHILRTALLNTRELRSAWLARLITRARMHHENAKAGAADFTGIRNLRSPNLAIDTDWFLAIRPLIFGTLRSAVGEPQVAAGPATAFFKLMEEAESWLQEEMGVLDGPVYPLVRDTPPHMTDLGAVESTSTTTATATATGAVSPFIGDIYKLSIHNASAQNTLDRLRAIHLETIEIRKTQVSKKRRQRLTWLANKVQAKQEAEAEALRVAEKKAGSKADRQRAARPLERQSEVERDEGMMLAGAAAAA